MTSGSRLWSTPDPSPDGEWVVFYSLTQPEGQLYVSHPDGTGLRQVTNDMAVDRAPRWSPDGKYLAVADGGSPNGIGWSVGGCQASPGGAAGSLVPLLLLVFASFTFRATTSARRPGQWRQPLEESPSHGQRNLPRRMQQ